MQIVGTWTLKVAHETVPGELIWFGTNSRDIGVVLELSDDAPLVGTFKSADEPHPRLLRLGVAENCASFGTDWLLEPVLDEKVFPNNYQNHRSAGVLIRSNDSWLMNFASSGVDQIGRFNAEWWDLKNFTPAKRPPNPHIAFTRWSIWPDAQNRDDPRSTALMEFEAHELPRA